MLSKYKELKITFDQLNDIKLPLKKPFILSIEWSGVNYEFLIRLNRRTSKLLVFGSGAYKPSSLSLPLFHRHSWINDFKESIIFYNDPTLYLGTISIGWGQGTIERFYLKDIAEILKIIISKMNYKNENVYFYGSSAGGFMSVMLATFIKNTTVLVNNPQTIITNYYERNVKNLFKYSYNGMPKEEVIENFPERINVVNAFIKENYIPKIYYLQNVKCEHDMNNHLLPFINQLMVLDNNILFNKINLELYSNEKLGHNPVSKIETIQFINRVINS